MSSNELFLIRIPNKVEKKLLNGQIIDLNGCLPIDIGNETTTDHISEKLFYSYDCDLIDGSNNTNLVKLNKTSDNNLKVDKTVDFCGYIRFRIERQLTIDSENCEPMAKRHCVEPIETYIKPIDDDIQVIETIETNLITLDDNVKPEESPKKKRRKRI